MRSTSFRDNVLFAACDDLGIDVGNDLPKPLADTLARSINRWTKEGWRSWTWPELNLTEERAFRDEWSNATAYTAGAVFYYSTNGLYYRTKADAPAATLPTNAVYFEELPEPWERYIAYDQAGKDSIGIVRSISSVDPRVSRGGYNFPFGPGDNGINIYDWGGTTGTVWIRYQVRQSQFSGELVVSATNYPAGKVIYDKASGECYLALVAATGNELADPAKWKRQPMPEFLAAYVKYNAAADQADDKDRAAELRGLAAGAWSRETDILLEQGMAAPTYNIGQRRSRGLPNKNFVLVASG